MGSVIRGAEKCDSWERLVASGSVAAVHACVDFFVNWPLTWLLEFFGAWRYCTTPDMVNGLVRLTGLTKPATCTRNERMTLGAFALRALEIS